MNILIADDDLIMRRLLPTFFTMSAKECKHITALDGGKL
jgi:hypothetical protein